MNVGEVSVHPAGLALGLFELRLEVVHLGREGHHFRAEPLVGQGHLHQVGLHGRKSELTGGEFGRAGRQLDVQRFHLEKKGSFLITAEKLSNLYRISFFMEVCTMYWFFFC